MIRQTWIPHAEHTSAVEALTTNSNMALFMPLGFSKTTTLIKAFQELREAGRAKRALVIAPINVCVLTWPSELEKWDISEGLSHCILRGSQRERLLRQRFDISLINPEALSWLLDLSNVSPSHFRLKLNLERWRSFGFDTLIVDELTKFKNTNTLAFKLIKQIHKEFKTRWGVTATPAANGYEGVFGQIYTLDAGQTLGHSKSKYMSTYFSKSYDGFTWDLQPEADKKIIEAIKPVTRFYDVPKSMNIKPEMIVNEIAVELNHGSRAMYDAMHKQFLVSIDDQHVIAPNAAAKLIKCRQIANGAVYLTDPVVGISKDWLDIHNHKTDALADLIEQLQGQPLLLAYEFKHEKSKIKHRFKDKITFMSDCNEKALPELIQRWNAGKVQVLAGQPASMGHGLNLQESSFNLCWFGPIYNLELYDQFNGRLVRRGNPYGHVFAHHILAKDTVDELVLARLKEKDMCQNKFLQSLKK